jgi:hypothetical protein
VLSGTQKKYNYKNTMWFFKKMMNDKNESVLGQSAMRE